MGRELHFVDPAFHELLHFCSESRTAMEESDARTFGGLREVGCATQEK
jgi:hypothetical protein